MCFGWTVRFPDRREGHDGADPGGAAAGLGGIPGGKETILLAEDELCVRKLASGILAGRGYTVLKPFSPAAFLRVVREILDTPRTGSGLKGPEPSPAGPG